MLLDPFMSVFWKMTSILLDPHVAKAIDYFAYRLTLTMTSGSMLFADYM